MTPLRRTVLFLLPLIVVFGVPALVLWLGGEMTEPDTVVERQLSSAKLVLDGAAYTNPTNYVKLRAASRLRPKVLALGNSRILELRREFFRREVSFYNCGSVAVRLQHFRAFLETLPEEALPETMIIALEGGYFNLQFDKLDRDGMNLKWMRNELSRHPTRAEIYLGSWYDVWRDIWAGKIKWGRLCSMEGLRTQIGLNALFNDVGYRNDGSYQYGAPDLDITNPHHRDYQFAWTLRFVRAGKGRFVWGDEPSEPALLELDALLNFCDVHHIFLVGFMAPHAHAVWQAMHETEDHYAYLPKLTTELRSRFAGRGFEFYDFSDFATFGARDTEAVDGFHGNERAYLRLFVAMLDQGSRLNAYANRSELKAALADTTAPAKTPPPLQKR